MLNLLNKKDNFTQQFYGLFSLLAFFLGSTQHYFIESWYGTQGIHRQTSIAFCRTLDSSLTLPAF